ncbi:MAG TPA: GAF domain-containing sensor histidine kinase [Polyangia bacterium]|nr:GAF domain-containing sensor histidine kinase [Polyangia bacterium]
MTPEPGLQGAEEQDEADTSSTPLVPARIVEIRPNETARDLRAQWAERLMRVTAAIAEAVTADQVFQAIVGQTAAALGAASAGLWLVREGEPVARLRHATERSEARGRPMPTLPLDGPASFPIADAIRSGELIWIGSPDELRARYPQVSPPSSPGAHHAVVCLPLAIPGRRLGALALTFDDERQLGDAERTFLLLIGRYSGQALERLRLLQDEKESRARAELLHDLAAAVITAGRVEEVFDAALEAIVRALDTERAAVLLHDADDVMRFRAWRGLSKDYRRAADGHSPWRRDARDPQPVLVLDVELEPPLLAHLRLLRREKIGALGFIPLVFGGRLLGELVLYYPAPREVTAHELELARAIANHVAAAVARFESLAELQETVHFNEMFTGILGHDLRNPLAAIITSARLAMTRDPGERLRRPLARILSSGDRMTRMIDQLLDFTRVRLGGGIPVAPVEIDLATLVRQVVDELDEANPESALRVSFSGDTMGRWDPDRLSQVFSNLVANAVRHGEPGHGVDVTVDGRPEVSIRVTVHNMGAIPARRLPKLFEPLAGASRRPEKAQGLGLGLFITRELVRVHGGSIEVRSDEASGTTFTVTLPRVSLEPPRS